MFYCTFSRYPVPGRAREIKRIILSRRKTKKRKLKCPDSAFRARCCRLVNRQIEAATPAALIRGTLVGVNSDFFEIADYDARQLVLVAARKTSFMRPVG